MVKKFEDGTDTVDIFVIYANYRDGFEDESE